TASLFSETAAIDIEYVYLDTFDEIAPQTAYLLKEWERSIKGGVSTSPHRKGYRTNSRYLDIDYASPYFAELLRSGKEAAHLDYETACAYAKELWSIELRDILTKEEYENALSEKDIEEEYLDVTGADTRLMELADEITKGCDTDYDKSRQIEAFLRQYSYSTDSQGGYDKNSDMTNSRGMADISERFLFDTGEGYCVHFTSSMVMLLRLSGIPARAVTGYRYAFPFEREDEYHVSSSCAHAWPEAYIEGAGWIPFEPTSAYYSQADSSWHKAPAPLEEEKNTSLKDVPKAYVEPESLGEQENSFATNSLIALKVLWPFIVSAILLVLLLIAGTRLIRYLRYKYASPTKQYLFDVELIKKALVKASGHQIYDRGLLSDYVPLAPGDMQGELKDVFSVCYRLLYGADNANSPTPEENALARALREKLEKKK
ncbi:MAG: transglutaminase domain-containing protein, partial [Butyrivibrio sp.]|nr:transglutaminase domain-containing protein [Butyrivibrio sp.]